MKPVVIFTNFWDANKVVGLLPPNNKYKVYSIALSDPDLDRLPKLKYSMTRLDFFCPTWDILKKYKQDGHWEDYTKSFMELMHTRNLEVNTWLKTLLSDHRYFLCCWENTSKGSNCHRKLLYDVLKKLNQFKVIYRHG